MALLSDNGGPGAARRKSSRLVAVLALLMVAACTLIGTTEQQGPKPFAFSHRQHVGLKELACADCHSRWEDEEHPGMPRAAQCAICHNDLDAQKPEDRRAVTLFDGAEYRVTAAGRQSEEIVFSHKSHATRGLDCSACHTDVAQDEGDLAQHAEALRMSMDACVACHESSTGPRLSDCAACHVEIRAGAAPPNHSANWKRYHGGAVRGRSAERTDQCALCHRPSECVTCHSIELPESHTNYWRRRGHGLTASMDRASCATCHDKDSCDRCHEEIRPVSHVGQWGEPVDTHCLSCHEPLRGTSCRTCHPATPSHELATPLPPDHTPAMNCRACHGNGQPLPHKDNGMTCTSCHH